MKAQARKIGLHLKVTGEVRLRLLHMEAIEIKSKRGFIERGRAVHEDILDRHGRFEPLKQQLGQPEG